MKVNLFDLVFFSVYGWRGAIDKTKEYVFFLVEFVSIEVIDMISDFATQIIYCTRHIRSGWV